MSFYTILTEENPQLQEIHYILKWLNLSPENLTLAPHIDETTGKWKGAFKICTDNVLPATIHLKLFKGKGACVDYMVYDTIEPTYETTPILLLESTKTTDNESRNSSVYQRFTKFAELRYKYPTTPLVLFYTTPQNPHTKTAILGLQLLQCHGVHVVDVTGKNLLTDIPKLSSADDVIKAKNDIPEKKGNVSVKITKSSDHCYAIQAKLCKGEKRDLNHDPNIGLVTGLCSAIHAFDKEATFVVKEHGITITDKLKPTAKFWYANRGYCLKLEGCDLSTAHSTPPKVSWELESQSEKAATILFELLAKQQQQSNRLTTIFHNHSSSARSSFTLPNNTQTQVPKTCTIPDIVLLDATSKTIYICEGKISKDITLGINQLNALAKFEEFVLSHYTGYQIKKGLCIYTPTPITTPTLPSSPPTATHPYPTWFTLDKLGNYTMNLSP